MKKHNVFQLLQRGRAVLVIILGAAVTVAVLKNRKGSRGSRSNSGLENDLSRLFKVVTNRFETTQSSTTANAGAGMEYIEGIRKLIIIYTSTC